MGMERLGSGRSGQRLIPNSTSLQKAIGFDDPNLPRANSNPKQGQGDVQGDWAARVFQ